MGKSYRFDPDDDNISGGMSRKQLRRARRQAKQNRLDGQRRVVDDTDDEVDETPRRRTW